MKQLILSVLILISFGCSKSKEDLAKENIKKYLVNTMNDFSSYEPVEFGKIDSNFLFYNETNQYLADSAAFYACIDNFKKHNDKMESEISSIKILGEYATAKQKADLKEDMLVSKFFRIRADSLFQILAKDTQIAPKFIGYKMFHSLRGKNSFGAKVLEQKVFYFDSSLKILKTLDWKSQP